MAEPVRLIKRYANRKLYDTGNGELTSLGRIEELVREGVDIRVVDHDTGEDMTSEVLVGILGNAMGAGKTVDGDKALLMSLIRTPDDLLAAMVKDDQRTEELRAMGERVRLLSATIDALLGQMDQGESASPPPAKPRPAKAQPAKSPGTRTRAGQARTPRS